MAYRHAAGSRQSKTLSGEQTMVECSRSEKELG